MWLKAFPSSIFLSCLALFSCAEGEQAAVVYDESVAATLRAVDKAIDDSKDFEARKSDAVQILRSAFAKAQTDQSRYDIAYSLYEEYKPLEKDSALHFLDVSIEAARNLGDRSLVAKCAARKAQLCSNTGAYVESLEILRSIDTTGVSRDALIQYYFAIAHVCGEVAFYTPLAEKNGSYGILAWQYRQRILAEADHHSPEYFQMKEQTAMDAHDTVTSMAVNNEWLKSTERGSHAFALVALYRFYEFGNRRDTTNMLIWLGEAIIADIRNGVMDQGALQEMANQLMVKGDINRAYRYICYTSDCVERFGSRQRLSSLSPLMTRIAQRYKEANEASQEGLRLTIKWICVLSFFLLAAVFFLGRQRNALREAKDRLARSNSDLTNVNNELVESNSQLSFLNMQRKTLNSQLLEANKVKEEYVGRFMKLCSLYVDRLQSLRLKIKTMAMAGKWTEIKALTRGEDFETDEMDELYANFDAAFLHLYPDFVSQFNALLTPEGRQTPSAPGRLNTQMRIFALIRLGITDSGQISEILHYSVNTIYNYRAQIKKAAACPKDDFEERVKAINI